MFQRVLFDSRVLDIPSHGLRKRRSRRQFPERVFEAIEQYLTHQWR